MVGRGRGIGTDAEKEKPRGTGSLQGRKGEGPGELMSLGVSEGGQRKWRHGGEGKGLRAGCKF